MIRVLVLAVLVICVGAMVLSDPLQFRDEDDE